MKIILLFVQVSTYFGFTLEQTTEHRHIFEGVNWDLHEPILEEHTNCLSEFVRCIRRIHIHNPVCGYLIVNYESLHTGNKVREHYYNFDNLCELELTNCEERVKKGIPVTGNRYYDDIFYHNGEGYDCHFYYKRSNSPDEMDLLYFKGRKDEILSGKIQPSPMLEKDGNGMLPLI